MKVHNRTSQKQVLNNAIWKTSLLFHRIQTRATYILIRFPNHKKLYIRQLEHLERCSQSRCHGKRLGKQ